MERTIWTPRLHGRCEFGVYLDSNFAREMIQSRIPTERQTQMNKLVNKELEELGVYWLNQYSFHEDSCFVTQFSIGQNGVWLSTKYQTIDDLLKGKSLEIVKYNSHNVDTPNQAYILMVLFDKWVEYAAALKSG